MAFRFRQTSNFTKMFIVVEFFIVSYLLYTLTASVYKNYEIDQLIKKFEYENTQKEQQILQMKGDLDYSQTIAYKEKILKQNFNYVYPGEKVIYIVDNKNGEEQWQNDEMKKKNNFSGLSNPEKWWKFFFDSDV